MSTQSPQPGVLRVIGVAMAAGIVFFAIAASFVANSVESEPLGEVEPFLVYGALVFALVAPIPAWFVRGAIHTNAQRTDDEVRAKQFYAHGSILFFALLEGPALLNGVVWILTGNPFPSVLGMAVPLLLILSQLPSDEAFRQLREMRGLS